MTIGFGGVMLRSFYIFITTIIYLSFLSPLWANSNNSIQINDPIEDVNRGIFWFNEKVDYVTLRPVAYVYKEVMPEFVKERVGNVIDNLSMPKSIANDILQGELSDAGHGLLRFAKNTIFGIGGLFNLDEKTYHFEDFGQTLGVWGVDHGFYLVLPILGPSSLRDTVGRGVDTFLDPVSVYAIFADEPLVSAIRRSVEVIHWRAETMVLLDDIKKESSDYYAKIKSLYHQRRDAQVRDGEFSYEDGKDLPVIEEEDEIGEAEETEEVSSS